MNTNGSCQALECIRLDPFGCFLGGSLAAAWSCANGDSPLGDQGLCTCRLVCGSPHLCGSFHPAFGPTHRPHPQPGLPTPEWGYCDRICAPVTLAWTRFSSTVSVWPASRLSLPSLPRGRVPALLQLFCARGSCCFLPRNSPARPPSTGCCGEKGGTRECQNR